MLTPPLGQFYNFAEEIVNNAESNAKAIVGQVKSLSIAVTSAAITNGMVWPNVTVSHFDRQAREAEALTGIELLVFSPIVPYEEKEGWEAYAWDHQSWIQEDLMLLGDDTIDPGSISRHIYAVDSEDVSEVGNTEHRHLEVQDMGIYVPVWQLGPVPSNASVINLDLNTHPSFKMTIFDVLDTNHEMLSDVVNLDFLLKNSLLDHALDDHPRSYILQPVMEDFYNYSKVVGFLVADLKWQSFFVDLLPATVTGITIIVHGTCDGDFSYKIDGHEASFVAASDAHDTRYNEVERIFQFAEFARYDGNQPDMGCNYTLSVFPTQEFENGYHSNKPALYAAGVVLIFFITASVFALYDYTVRVRQRKLHAKAKRTNQIVASMFPKEFQNRIMEEAAEQANEKHVNKNKRLRDVLADAEANDVEGAEKFTNSKPIADLYTSVTIMFADVVGKYMLKAPDHD